MYYNPFIPPKFATTPEEILTLGIVSAPRLQYMQFYFPHQKYCQVTQADTSIKYGSGTKRNLKF